MRPTPPPGAFVLDDDDEEIYAMLAEATQEPEYQPVVVPEVRETSAPGRCVSLMDTVRQIQDNQQDIAEAQQLLQDLLGRSTTLSQTQTVLEQAAVLSTLSSSGHLLGCHQGRPVAALLIHRCLLHWNTFTSPEGTRLLDQLLAIVAAQATEEEQRDSSSAQDLDQQAEPTASQSQASSLGLDRLAYWLASSSTLLALVTKLGSKHSCPENLHHQEIPASSALGKFGAEVQKKLSTFRSGWAKGFLGKMAAKTDDAKASEGHQAAMEDDSSRGPVTGSTPSSTTLTLPQQQQQQQQHDAVADLHAFWQQLSLLTLQLYNLLRDQYKKQLASLLPACVQRATGPASPSGSQATSPRTLQQAPGSPWGEGHSGAGPQYVTSALGLGTTAILRPWSDLVLQMSSGLVMLQEQGVPRIIIKCLMKQMLSFMDVQLFNQLLLRPECCAASNVHYMAEGLAHLDAWLVAQGSCEDTAYLMSLQTDLRHTRQALSLLVHPNKGSLDLPAITHMCASLSLQQLYRLSTTFWDDRPAEPEPHQVHRQPSTVIETRALGHPAPATQPQEEQQAGPGPQETGPGPQETGPRPQETSPEPQETGPEQEQKAQEGQEPGVLKGDWSPEAQGVAGPASGVDRAATAVEHTEAPGLLPSCAGSLGMVSGEVLEELKGKSQVSSNGGLIVTFLLDEDHQALIAARPSAVHSGVGCAVANEVLALIDDTLAPSGSQGQASDQERPNQGWLYRGMPVPPQLLNPNTPKEPFVFLEKDVSI